MIAWAALLPALVKGAKVAQGVGAVAGAMSPRRVGNAEQMVHDDLPQLPTMSMQPMQPLKPLHQGNYTMQDLMPIEQMQSLELTPEYNWNELLGQGIGKGKQWMKKHPLMTAGLAAGAMGLATRGNPNAMALGGLVGNTLARRIPTIGG